MLNKISAEIDAKFCLTGLITTSHDVQFAIKQNCVLRPLVFFIGNTKTRMWEIYVRSRLPEDRHVANHTRLKNRLNDRSQNFDRLLISPMITIVRVIKTMSERLLRYVR